MYRVRSPFSTCFSGAEKVLPNQKQSLNPTLYSRNMEDLTPTLMPVMLWIVQEDLFIENKRSALLGALDRLGIEVHLVQVGNNTINPDLDLPPGSAVITNGSIMLSRIASERGWVPGSMFNENFSFEVWSQHYQDLLLNKDAQMGTLAEVAVSGDKAFVRPLSDTKAFNGRVFAAAEFQAFQAASLAKTPGSPRPDTPILVAPVKKIGQEHRHYIVDGEVITSSRYKLAGQPNFREGADDAVIEVVKHAIARWQPARAFVMDTYIAEGEIGIVEIGGICHAGLYEADLIKLVHALDSMPIVPAIQPAASPARPR